MDWDRAKTILIILLCALNLFLLGNYLYTRHAQAEASQTQAELSAYLSGRGVTLSCTVPKKAETGRALMIAENTDRLAGNAVPVLLGQDAYEENGEMVSSSGRLLWVAGELSGVIDTLPDGSAADLDAVIRLLASAGIESEATQIGETSAVLSGVFGDPAEPVYNMRLQIDAGEGDSWMISGRWFLGDPAAAGEERERDAAGLLVTFTDRLLTQRIELGEISGMEKGWVSSTLTNVGTALTPAFRITTDAGIYYISALDGRALDLN